MNNLIEYVAAHTERGACRCGHCIDAGIEQPEGHTVSVYFFEVAKRGEPTVEEFRQLVTDHRGVFTEVDLFDGKEHGYIELGGWAGDQGLALQVMALGALLGLWELMHPGLLPIPKSLQDQLAGRGLILIKAPAPAEA